MHGDYLLWHLGHGKMVDYLLPACGLPPKYLVADGKADGPVKRRVDHLGELDHAEEENGDLLKQLVSDINNRYQGEIPKAYARFLKNISRATSVAGWLQCTGPDALQYIREFTHNTLDLRHRNNKEKLSV